MTISPREEDPGRLMGWDPQLNLSAYADVESESNYAGPDQLARYRELLLRKSAPVVDFIKAAARPDRPLETLELCAGSGRVLYALDAAKLLRRGVGIEVSHSRHRFAERWKEDLRAEHVTNICAAADPTVVPDRPLDLVIMIDGALSYMFPCDPTLPEKILKRVRRDLTPNGMVLLEFDVLTGEQLDRLQASGEARVWYEGDEKDAFKYALYQTEIVEWSRRVVANTSIYIPRSGTRERIKRELYKYFSTAELDQIFGGAGFSAEYFGAFDGRPFAADAPSLIALARPV